LKGRRADFQLTITAIINIFTSIDEKKEPGRGPVHTYLGLGSNKEDRFFNLYQGILALDGIPRLKRIKTSSVYESEPWGKSGQAWFLNQVTMIESSLFPDELLSTVQAIEDALGRDRREKWGPRSLDIDILAMGSLRIQRSNLQIPHPLLAERRFVLVPLHEIAPDLLIPGKNQTVTHLLRDCMDTGRVNRIGEMRVQEGRSLR